MKVDAAKDVSISGGNVTIQAATDRHTVSGTTTTGGKGLTAGQVIWHDPSTGINAKKTTETVIQDTTLARSTLNGANVSITAKDTLALAGTTVNRILAAAGLVPVAGGIVRKVGEPVVETLVSVLRALDGVNGIAFARSQVQHAFKHAADFGVPGNANNKTLSEFEAALQSHVVASTTTQIQGTYRGVSVTHYVDPNTGLNVMRDSSGNFLSGWKLSDQQLQNVLTRGKL